MAQIFNQQRIFMLVVALYTLLGMHYFQQNLGGSGLELPINPVGWTFISILIGVGLWQITLQRKISYNRLTIIFLIAVIIMLIPVFYGESNLVGQSYSRLLGLFGGFLFFFALQQMQFSSKQQVSLLFLVLAAVFIEASLSLVQYYLLPVNNVMGYAKLANRPYGIFQQPNVSASFLVTGIALSLYLLCLSKAKILQTVCYLVAFVATIPVVLLLSRIGYIALIVAPLLVLPWVIEKQKNNGSLKSVFIWLGLFILGLALGQITLEFATTVARDSAELTNPGGRIPIYQHSLAMMLQKPWLGWGYGSFEYNYLHSYALAMKEGQAILGSPENLDHPHNELLLWVIEGGIVPLMGIALMAWGVLSQIFKASLMQGLAFVGLLFPILLHTQTEYPFYHSVSHWFIFILLIWYMFESTSKRSTFDFNYTFFFRTFALLIPLMTSFYMVTTLQTTNLLVQYQGSNPKDLTPLLRVINPMSWITRLEFDVMQFRLQSALYSNDKKEIANYISWAEKMVQLTPRANIYINWIYALEKLGKNEQAKQLLSKTEFLYPQDKRLTEIQISEKSPSFALNRLNNS